MDVKIFTNNIEGQALNQIYTLAKLPAFADSKIRIMPDVHAGAGCVIGFTADLGDKVIPNIVGVDIGCLDEDTEFITEKGFKKISDYVEGDKVLQYNVDTDEANFVTPYAYINQPCNEFWHFKNSKGLDQKVSEEHRMLVYKGYKTKGYNYSIFSPSQLESKNLEKGYYNFKAAFHICGEGVKLSDNQLRIRVALCADGRLRVKNTGLKIIEFHFTKDRKIKRLQELLDIEKINYTKSLLRDGSTLFYISSFNNNLDIYDKTMNDLYKANYTQLKVITDECLLWDGHKGDNYSYFSTTNKEYADFIQFAFSAVNVRAGISVVHNKNTNESCVYIVTPTKNEYVGYSKPSHIKGNFRKYCFVVPSSYFIIRRNGKISITGNCGMYTIQLSNKIGEINLAEIDEVIRRYVPSGHNVHDDIVVPFNWEELYCAKYLKNTDVFNRAVGSLGGGNHFIEIDKDENDNLYLIIHTGSRNLGKQVAEYYQKFAIKYHKETKTKNAISEIITKLKAEGRTSEIESAIIEFKRNNISVSDELCWLEGADREAYLHDMKICQEYAKLNRRIIASIILSHTNLVEASHFETVHNYIDHDSNIVRKGAIRANKGERVLIPLNMRDGCIIGIGKGNEDWNCSAPHGAGRVLSRSKAKEQINMDDYVESMQGIFTTSVCESTIDESPFAYKPSEEIISLVSDTIDIERIINPIYNFKASE